MKKFYPYLPALFLASAFASCSDDDAGFQPVAVATHAVPADAGKLIPADAVGVVHIKSIDGLMADVRAIVGAFQPGGEGMVDQLLGPAIQMTGLRAGDLDLAASGTVALSMSPLGPMPTFIIAAKNASESADVTEMPAVASGKYVGICMAAEPKVGAATPAIATDLPDSDFAIRLDLAKILPMVKPMIEPFLDPSGWPIPMDPQGLPAIKSMMSGVKSFIDSAKGLDVDLSLAGGALKLGFSYDGGPSKLGSEVQGPGAIALASMLRNNNVSMVGLGNANAELFDLIMPMYRELDKAMPDGGKLVPMLLASKAACAKMDGGVAMAMTLDNGISGSMIMRSSDPEQLAKDLFTLFDKNEKLTNGAIQFTAGPDVDIDGHQFAKRTLKMDAKKMLEMSGQPVVPEMVQMQEAMMSKMMGADGVTYSIGVVGDHVVVNIGGDDASTAALVAAAKSNKGTAHAMVTSALAELRVKPAMFFAMDLRKVMAQMAKLMVGMAPIPPVPDGKPVVLWMALGEKDGRTVGQLHVDLVGIGNVVRAMKPK